MNLLPTFVGTRPRLACEIRPEGVVAARGESPSGTLTAVARAELRPGLVVPSLKPGNLPDRPSVVAALRRAFDGIAARGADRSRYVTVIIPDASVRVLLLDFDALPSKPAEALQVVRFRLRKLLPFDVDHALVSFQIMSTERTILRVLAVAIPQEVLSEYEAAVSEAGLQPGVVLPSTLAALAGLDPASGNALVLNASPVAMTTAIVRAGVLLLHRTVEVYPSETGEAAGSFAAVAPSAVISTTAPTLPPVAAVSTGARPFLDLGTSDPPSSGLAFVDPADTAEEWSRPELDSAAPFHADPATAVATLNTAPDFNNRARDLAESVSVAAAYFEDTLGTTPDLVLSAGTTSAAELDRTLLASGLEGLRVRELLDSAAVGPGASTVVSGTDGLPPAAQALHPEAIGNSASARPGSHNATSSQLIPPGWLAGLRGALRS